MSGVSNNLCAGLSELIVVPQAVICVPADPSLGKNLKVWLSWALST